MLAVTLAKLWLRRTHKCRTLHSGIITLMRKDELNQSNSDFAKGDQMETKFSGNTTNLKEADVAT